MNFLARGTFLSICILKGEKPADLPVQGADQIQIGHQSKDGQIAWSHYPNDVARHRRRGDRINRSQCGN